MRRKAVQVPVPLWYFWTMEHTKKISVGTFNVTFKAQPDGRVDWVMVRPNMCSASGQESSLEDLFKRIGKYFAEESQMYGMERIDNEDGCQNLLHRSGCKCGR